MKRRFSEEQIIGILKQHESGVPTSQVCRDNNISSATFYKWKSKFGGMNVSEAQRLRRLEAENAKLKRIVADLKGTRSLFRTSSQKTGNARRQTRSRAKSAAKARTFAASGGWADRVSAQNGPLCVASCQRPGSVGEVADLAHQKPAAGYRMLWSLLRGEGVSMNHKKVYRIYKEEQLALRPKGKKRLKSEGGCPLGGVCHNRRRLPARNGPWTSSMTPWPIDALFAL